VLIAGDEPKRGVKDLWDYVSQLDIRINHATSTIATCKLRANYYKNMLCKYLKALPQMWLKMRAVLHNETKTLIHMNSY